MISLSPSKSIVRETQLDFSLISFILSQFIKTKRHVNLKVEKSRTEYSAFYVNDNLIKILLKEKGDLQYYIKTILHEVRHYIQVRVKKQKLMFEYDNYIEYYTSPEEKDARNFEKLATEVCHIYRCYKKINEKISLFEMDSPKEPWYNKGVEDKQNQQK